MVTMLIIAAQDALTKTLAQDLAVAQIVMVRYWMFAAFATVLIARRRAASARRRAPGALAADPPLDHLRRRGRRLRLGGGAHPAEHGAGHLRRLSPDGHRPLAAHAR
jgi:hypothetical protein